MCQRRCCPTGESAASEVFHAPNLPGPCVNGTVTGLSVGIHDVWRRYGAVTAVGGVTLSVAAGEFVSLLGPSGSGKTTLLMMLAGFEVPDAGPTHRWRARHHPASRPTSATSRWCSSDTRCSRT